MLQVNRMDYPMPEPEPRAFMRIRSKRVVGNKVKLIRHLDKDRLISEYNAAYRASTAGTNKTPTVQRLPTVAITRSNRSLVRLDD